MPKKRHTHIQHSSLIVNSMFFSFFPHYLLKVAGVSNVADSCPPPTSRRQIDNNDKLYKHQELKKSNTSLQHHFFTAPFQKNRLSITRRGSLFEIRTKINYMPFEHSSKWYTCLKYSSNGSYESKSIHYHPCLQVHQNLPVQPNVRHHQVFASHHRQVCINK